MKCFQPIEFVARCPVRHQIGIGDENPRRMRKRPEDADRFAGLDKQSLVVLQVSQRANDRVISLPASCGPAGASIDNKLARVLRDLFVEVVHEHPHGRFLLPAFAGDRASARSADRHVIRHLVPTL